MNRSETFQDIDAALAATRRTIRHVTPESRPTSWVGAALRYAGGVSLFTASVVLLLQRYEGSDHVMQYMAFLVLTLVTGGAGLLCGLHMRESKGARLLLSFVAGMAAVHGSQLGALLYSVYGTPLSSYPPLLLWQAHSPMAAWTCVGIGAAVMIPMIALAYAVLDRASARSATIGAVLLNGSLLLPFRDPQTVATLVLGQAALCTGIVHWSIGRSVAITKKRFIIALTLALPVLVTTGRQVTLYSVTPLLVASLLTATALLLITVAPVKRVPKAASCLQLVALAHIFMAWFIALDGWHFFDAPPTPAYTFIIVLPVVLVALALSLRPHKGAGLFDSLAGAVLMTAVCRDLTHDANFISSALHLLASVAVLTWACLNERKFLLVVGLVGLVIGMGQHMVNTLVFVTVSPWILLGAAGIATVVLGSYLEKHGEGMKMYIGLWRRSMRGWSM